MTSAPLVVVLAAFVVGAAATWAAGVELSRATDELDRRLGLGDALGGMILLSVAGSMPEIAITISAAASGNLPLAAGNLVGGIATATMVIVICDLFAPRPITFLIGSLVPVLEGLLVSVLIALVLLGSLLPTKIAIHGVSPVSVLVVVAWTFGIWVLDRTRRRPKWEVTMKDSEPGRPHRRVRLSVMERARKKHSMSRTAIGFGIATAVTLGAGVLLEVSGAELATRANVNQVLFGATFLALASALPEISSGIEAVLLGDHQLAIGDVFGGNAFQLCLFLLADVVAMKPTLPTVGPQNAWLGGMALIITATFLGGIIVRPTKPRRIGPDSILAMFVYAAGMIGLLQLH